MQGMISYPTVCILIPTHDLGRLKRTLHRSIPLRTRQPQRRTPTPHVANLGLPTRLTRTIRTLDTQPTLILILRLHQPQILLHRLRHPVPKRRIKRRVRRPAHRRRVRRARGVLIAVRRPGGGQSREGRHVCVEGVRIINVEVTRIDFVHAEPRVEVRERGDAGADPSGGEGVGGVAHGAVVGVVEEELVLVGVAEEDPRDDVGREALDDLVEEVGGVGQRVGAVPAAEDVADEPDALAAFFGRFEFFDHPAEDAGCVGVGGVDEHEDVVAVPEVGVEGDDAKPEVRLYAVAAIVGGGLVDVLLRNPPFMKPELAGGKYLRARRTEVKLTLAK